MTANGELNIRQQGRSGRITLTRPGALNALTHEMALAMEAALASWSHDESVDLVMVDAEGERAFCAGGDIEKLYESGKSGDFDYGRRFWSDEYRLNAMIAEYSKPYVAFMQGFVMGGGVGIGCHGSHRVVGRSTRIAMPECGIGLVPDVGGSFLLARAPGKTGYYLGLTGTRMNAADAIHAGFADVFIAEDHWEPLKDEISATGDLSVLNAASGDPGPVPLNELKADIDRYFSGSTALDCVSALEADGSDWTIETAAALRRGCPLSVACTHALLGMNRNATTAREALANELRFTWRSMSHGEFLEGVRAQIIDKDRKPAWQTPRLEDVTSEDIDRMLAPLPTQAQF